MRGMKSILIPWLKKALRNHTSDECLLWPFCKDRKGYGKMLFEKKHKRVSHVVFYLTNGYWPKPSH